MSDLPTVTTAREYGARGYAAGIGKYPKATQDAWRRMGGRRPNRTYSQLMAGVVPQRARPRKTKEEKPITEILLF
jgi:hypothetical protein